eukprot:3314524-Alexandrium_andersonii.AAC.1
MSPRCATFPGGRQPTPRRACAGLASGLPTAGYAWSAQYSKCRRTSWSLTSMGRSRWKRAVTEPRDVLLASIISAGPRQPRCPWTLRTCGSRLAPLACSRGPVRAPAS